MAGLLIGKERIFDTILTLEGRRQVSTGELKAVYVSFTDSSAFYATDTLVSGGLEASNRLVLEASNLHQDQVTMEADDSGLLQAFPISGSERFVIRQGQVLSSSNGGVREPVTGSQFNSLAGTLLSSSIDNFKKLYILQSPDPLDSVERQFLIGPEATSFTITHENPIPSSGIQEASLDNVESLFYDKRLSHIPNFQFLPPINSPEKGSLSTTVLGDYVDLNQQEPVTYEEAVKEIDDLDSRGFSTTVYFTETSRQNNLACQFFELSDNVLSKLDIIDYGEFTTTDGTKHIFYAGKVFEDSYGAQTFVNIFTFIFE